MNKSSLQPNTDVVQTVFLYRVVFVYRSVGLVVCGLLLSFLLQPIERAYADETSAPAEQETEPAPVNESEPEPKPDTQPEVLAEENINSDTLAKEEGDASTDKDAENAKDNEVASEADDTEIRSENEIPEPEISTMSDPESDGSTSTTATDSDQQVVIPNTTGSTTEAENEPPAQSESPEGPIEHQISTSTNMSPSSTDIVSAVADTSSSLQDTADLNDGATSSVLATNSSSTTDTSTSTTTSEPSSPTTSKDNQKISTTTIKTTSETDKADSVNASSTITSYSESASSDTTYRSEAVNDTPAASSTSSTTQVVYVKEETITDLNRHQFADHECVSVGDGAFYCSKDTSDRSVEADGVLAELDSEGDKEIYYQISGERIQITDNHYDDDAPFVDGQSNTIVWHRLINGRYQIMQYDLEAEVETQLTNNSVSNMEPAVAGNYVVWQQWHGGDWEIVLFDGTDANLLTNNDYHDVAPAIRDGYVMWHTTNAAADKLLSVYEIETGVSSIISDPDGGHVDNPRFVLVYDTVSENGDVITKEYDLESGDIRPVSSEPAPLPTKIPDPEPAGEEVALVGVKTNGRDDVIESTNDTETASTTNSGVEDLDKRTNQEATSTPVVTVTDPDMTADVNLRASSTEPLEETTEFDLVVEPYAASSSAQSVDTASTTNDVE